MVGHGGTHAPELERLVIGDPVDDVAELLLRPLHPGAGQQLADGRVAAEIAHPGDQDRTE
jgi:hypothetical protein